MAAALGATRTSPPETPPSGVESRLDLAIARLVAVSVTNLVVFSRTGDRRDPEAGQPSELGDLEIRVIGGAGGRPDDLAFQLPDGTILSG